MADLQAVHIPSSARRVAGRQGQVPDPGRARRGDVLLRAVRAGGGIRRGGHEDQGGALGFKIALRTLDHTRITIAAPVLGIAQGALDYALEYVREREQFGRSVAEFQGVQFMLADMAMKLEAARQLLKGW